MARRTAPPLVIISLLFIGAAQSRSQSIDWSPNPTRREAKLRFYVQGVGGGPSPGQYEVARASITSQSPTNFGQVLVQDGLLTAEPGIESETIGRLQGLQIYTDLERRAYTIERVFLFDSGAYNGSSVSVVGRIESTLDRESEQPIVGGTGVFKSAGGYAIRIIYTYDPITNYRVLEYTVYITYVD